jgi:hypothetical protein
VVVKDVPGRVGMSLVMFCICVSLLGWTTGFSFGSGGYMYCIYIYVCVV